MKKLGEFALWLNAVLLAASFPQELPAQAVVPVDIITTIAGGGARDGGLATDALVNRPTTVVFDSSGNLYFVDSKSSRVRKVDAVSGIITTVAGTGEVGFSGDGGLATEARLNRPVDIAFDSVGDLYIVDLLNRRIRKVETVTGIITTVAGTGLLVPFNGDNIPATSANLFNPTGIAIDSSDNIFIAVQNSNRIRKVNAMQIITTVAGTGSFSSAGDGGLATGASLRSPGDIAFDSIGNLYIAEINGHRIRKVDAFSGIITTFAGTGSQGFGGDGGPATSATLDRPSSIAADALDNLSIADAGNHRIREVDFVTGVITTIAGTGIAGFTGDGGPATSAQLHDPQVVGFDSADNFYVGDSANYRVRKVDAATGVITTIAGSGVGDGFLATDAIFNGPRNIVFDRAGNFYTADDSLVRKISRFPAIVTTVAGNTISGAGFSGDGGLATDAQLSNANDVEFDSLGNLYIADSRNHRIRRVDISGIITTVAGTGVPGFSGDGGAATSANLQNPSGVAVDSADNLYIADLRNQRIRKVDSFTGFITTVAGNGVAGFSGDGGPATNASIRFPFDVDIDSADNLYIADGNNHRIRKVNTSTGTITTVAGTGAAGFSGDGGPATSASIQRPFGVSVDSEDNLYIADNRNHRIRKVDATTGIISTITGTGILGDSGDGGLAVNAEINSPSGVGIDDEGSVYVSGSRRIRLVETLLSLVSLVDDLTEIVTDLDLPAELENSLVSKLNTALRALEDANENNDVAGINALKSFINEVTAQRGKKISEVLADALVDEAEQIIALLGG